MNAATVGPTLERLHASASRPVAIELLNSDAGRTVGLHIEEPWIIACGYEEKRATVDWQIETLTSELKGAPIRGTVSYRDTHAVPLWYALTQLGYGTEEEVVMKANVLPSQAASVAAAMAAHDEAIVHAHAGSGIVYGHFPAESVEGTVRIADEMLKLASGANANAVILRCPTSWKSRLLLWGRETADRITMRNVMRALDAQGRFNAGRLY